MSIRKITDEFSVSPQISADDLGAIAAAGYRSIICNRPDGEGPGQPSYSEIEAAARAAGLKTCYIPIRPGAMSDTDAEAFRTAMASLPRPVLAFCRSGARSTALWSRSQSTGRSLWNFFSRPKGAD